MRHICALCQQAFIVEREDLELLKRLSPKIGKSLLEIPAPSFCPKCRLQRRASHRNERNLYSNKCALSGKSIISIFEPGSRFKVYSQDAWWSDKWDPKELARDFDFSRTFFEQFAELQAQVPRISSLVKNCENCEYTNHSGNNKDCYLTSIVFNCENVYYSRKIFSSVAVVDCAYIFDRGELLYQCFWGENLHYCRFCDFCSDSSNLTFCFDCRGCHNCFMSSNQRNARFVFRNQQLSEQEYEARMTSIELGSASQCANLRAEFDMLCASAPRPGLRIEDSENAGGDFLLHCKDTHECFYAALGERCRYCVEFDRSANNQGSIDCMDSLGFGASELLYEVQAQANGYNNKFCSWSYDVANSLYLDMCFNVRNCFGCVGLHQHEEYCILNKSYSQQEYEELAAEIAAHMRKSGEWGEFFPAWLSPFGYNQSLAMELFPLSKEQAIAQGFSWSDFETSSSKTEQTLDAADLPEHIKQADASLAGQPICCSITGKPFRFLKNELDLYKQLQVPCPRVHPDYRHKLRMQKRPGFSMRDAECSKCSAAIKTSYSLEFSESLLCQICYERILYS